MNEDTMKIYKFFKKRMEVGPFTIEGYESLCKELNLTLQEDEKNKNRQLKELKHFIEYEKDKDVYIIQEVTFPFIREKFLNTLFLKRPDYYNMGCIYSYSDEEKIEFHYTDNISNIISKTYYHYHDKINVFYEYPEEKDLRIKIEKIIPITDIPSEAIMDEFNNFIKQYKQDYRNGLVNKKVGKETRKKPRFKKVITVYEEDYKKILKFAKEKGIKFLENDDSRDILYIKTKV